MPTYRTSAKSFWRKRAAITVHLSEVEDLRGTMNRFEAAVESLREFLEEEEDDW